MNSQRKFEQDRNAPARIVRHYTAEVGEQQAFIEERLSFANY